MPDGPEHNGSVTLAAIGVRLETLTKTIERMDARLERINERLDINRDNITRSTVRLDVQEKGLEQLSRRSNLIDVATSAAAAFATFLGLTK